ncbi:hypothetical protein PUNSTDRAFT_68736, partial [Punctularia strigosozonata HHB-11173 SS5]|uniref:uncharacterized protein n=1 Tax=Punctularia strigosozonata (strain HHB-11173) TaxID=741275 RepID=UPI000441809A
GWGSLLFAAGVSFYYAKKSINERRREQDLAGSRPVEKLDCELQQDLSPYLTSSYSSNLAPHTTLDCLTD